MDREDVARLLLTQVNPEIKARKELDHESYAYPEGVQQLLEKVHELVTRSLIESVSILSPLRGFST